MTDRNVPIGNHGDSSGNGAGLSEDHVVPSENNNSNNNLSSAWPIQDYNGMTASAIQAVPVEDSLQSTNSCDDLIV